jgi:hypothetical protein
MLIVQYKITYNNKIIAVIAVDSTGIRHIILKEDLNKYQYMNAKITSDNRIMGSIPVVNQDDLLKIGMLHMYHASHSGINFPINPDLSRGACDFGRGFYTGQLESQVKTLVVEDSQPVFYNMYADLSGLKVYAFKSAIEWVLFVAVNRDRVDCKKYPKLTKLVSYINSHDVVYGLIADDRMNYVFSEFVNYRLNIDTLTKALSYVNYGNQYTFKTQRACQRIQVVSRSILETAEIKQWKKVKSRTIGKLQNEIDELIVKNRHNNSKYFDELLEEYK